ncbi:PREDICTED: uncharacterized protein LOC109467429 [Branchiostoma belcheri]|uniref:Uncharacterized protein LOC109467429 n=1 Tax=Branchiostoma belcheri TaxID=7741 RepID=A0A6P4YG83_BRABE|nr:PREDICTED: uncharacterized protein LOC109467429 [Branchiostoma belcheri]
MASPMESEEDDSQAMRPELSLRSKLYAKISENLSEDDVENLRQMLITDELIGRVRVQNAQPHEIFNMLEDGGRIGVGNLGLLKELLRALRKGKLAEEAEAVENEEGMKVSVSMNKRTASEDMLVQAAGSTKQLKVGSDDAGSDHSDSSTESGIGCSASASQDMEIQDSESGRDLAASAEDITDGSEITTVGDVYKRIDYLRTEIAKLTRYPKNISKAKNIACSKASRELIYLMQLLSEQGTGELRVDIALLDTGTQQEFQKRYETGALGQKIQKEVKQIMRSTSDDIVHVTPDVRVDFSQPTNESTNSSPEQRAIIKVTAEDVQLEDSCRLDKDSAVRQLFKYLVQNTEKLHPIMDYLNSFRVQIRSISFGSIEFECICLTSESAVRLQEEYDGQRLHAQFQRVTSSRTIVTKFGIKSISLAVQLTFADEGPWLPLEPHIYTCSNMLEELQLDDTDLPEEENNQETPVQTDDSNDAHLVTHLGKLQIADETAEALPEQSAAILPTSDQPSTVQYASTTDLPTSQLSSTAPMVLCKTDIYTTEQSTGRPPGPALTDSMTTSE